MWVLIKVFKIQLDQIIATVMVMMRVACKNKCRQLMKNIKSLNSGLAWLSGVIFAARIFSIKIFTNHAQPIGVSY